jgi:transcription elongation factor GreA
LELTVVQRRQYITPAGHDKLQAELEHLIAVRRPDVAGRIHEATEAGGTADNAEYDEVKNDQAFIEGRIQDLEEILANAVIAEKDENAKDSVQFGSAVTVSGKGNKRQVYHLVGSAEANPLEGKISNESPVGRALLDHKVGDQVEVKTPAGVTTLKITKIA